MQILNWLLIDEEDISNYDDEGGKIEYRNGIFSILEHLFKRDDFYEVLDCYATDLVFMLTDEHTDEMLSILTKQVQHKYPQTVLFRDGLIKDVVELGKNGMLTYIEEQIKASVTLE